MRLIVAAKLRCAVKLPAVVPAKLLRDGVTRPGVGGARLRVVE